MESLFEVALRSHRGKMASLPKVVPLLYLHETGHLVRKPECYTKEHHEV
jgi:hypothetical protein